ncbi:P-loop containing nucleoside triphosphate hydrolase protein [Serendipita vermifera]|nr:P-loop containing nucleoside triphosphate hydrolase protein [Serendipita vermifera]
MSQNRKKIQSSTSAPWLQEYKLGVFGMSGAGKSSLAIEGSDYKKCQLEGEDVLIEVLDYTYQIESMPMLQIMVRDCEGCLFAYSINDRESFEGMKTLANTLLGLRGELPPIVVVGTKCDQELDREVTIQEGHKFATKLHGLHIETSAKLDVNVNAAFIDLAKLIKKRKNKLGARPVDPTDATDAPNALK